jgi:predicted N-formylglutamate amidohydrolase
MPRALRRLGVPKTERERHIAWDIGIAAVCRLVADTLDGTLVQQNYSRLVIDCNRTPGSETSIPEISKLTPTRGNIGLSERPHAYVRFSGHTVIGKGRDKLALRRGEM